MKPNEWLYMYPTMNIHNYYFQFIHKAKEELYVNTVKLDNLNKLKEETYNYLIDNQKLILDKYKIDLNKYPEIVNKTHNVTKLLYKKVYKLYKSDIDTDVIILQLLKYCKLLINECRLKKIIKFITRKVELPYRDYINYVYKFYYKAQEFILKGNGYTYGYGLGTVIISRWKLNGKRKKLKLNRSLTFKYLQQLIKQGKKVYNRAEYNWYKKHNIPYNAVDYRVYYPTSGIIYEIKFITIKSKRYRLFAFQPTKMMQFDYDEVAKSCKTEEDIFNLALPLHNKLYIYLKNYPNKYLNFMRHAAEAEYKNRNSYS